MARVNHKLIKQRLNEKRSKITDRQFFTSRILAGHFEDMAAAQTRRYRYNRRVHVQLRWIPRDPSLACTDNQVIRINAGNPLVTEVKGRENRYQIVTGLFAHELGHVLYTDFLAGQTHENSLNASRWYPCPPALKTLKDIDNECVLWGYAKADPVNLEMLRFIAHSISNVIEDGYIENRMLSEFPGTLGYGLEQLREKHFESMPTVTQLIEREESGGHIFESILQMILSYSKFGEIKYGDEPLSDERIQTVFSLITDIDEALMTHKGKDRLKVTNLIMVRCWEYIESFLEQCKEMQKAAEAAGMSGSIAQTLSEKLQAIAGGSEEAQGNSTPVPEMGAGGSSATSSQRQITHSLAESEAENENQTESGENNSPEDGDKAPQSQSGEEAPENEKEESVSSQSGEESLENEKEEPVSSQSDGDDEQETPIIPMAAGSIGESHKQDVSSTEGGRVPLVQSEITSVPEGGTIEYDTDYQREYYDRAAEDIERILDQMAEKAACEELENDRIRELNEAAQNISYGDIHEGINVIVRRIAGVDEELIDQYNAISAPLLTISRQLQRSLIKQLEENRRGGKMTGLVMGRRLDAHAIHRNDGKVFYKNSLPNELPELAVGLLLDESGSMGSCNRCTYARAAAIILYDFCQSLQIPVMVYGHSTGISSKGDAVELFSYAEFESFDQDDKYRMMDIAARGSNRDGAALRFVAERLSKRPERVKLLILVSDGQPADTNYYGTAAEEDLRGIKREYQKKGILFVAAAIGDDKQNIERIYGDSFLDISDLHQLPVKLTSVVKRHIRV